MAVAAPRPPWLTADDQAFAAGLRRELHQRPELAFEEHETARRVAGILAGAGLEVRTGLARTGVLGILRGDRPGRTMLIRADMDALPVQEAPGRPYGSRVAGKMHACGHDGHVAMAATAARVLARARASLAGNVVFAFQPAEETTGGAELMIKAGALDDPQVDAAIGIHLANTLPLGQVSAQAGPITASTDGFRLTITGQGGHAARPHLCVDPIVVTFAVGTALQTLVTRERSPAQPAVLTVGAIHGGTAGNVIADEVELRGTLRTYDPAVRRHLKQRMEELVTGIAGAMRAGARVEWDEGYPSTVNDPQMVDLVRQAAAQVVGEAGLVEHEASLGGDDMAYFCAAVPGCYFRVGSANAAEGLDGSHHSARFDFDERALGIGAEILVRATLEFVAGE
jgi:amidohydrolase